MSNAFSNSLAVRGPTCEQVSGKKCLVPLEAQISLVYHTKNPHSVLVGDFFHISKSEGWYDEILAQKRR